MKEFLNINGKLKGNWSKEKPVKYWYSNAGVTFLGYLIEQVSGQSFIEFIQKEIFDVLDIRTANWVAAKLDKRILVTNYEYNLKVIETYKVKEFPAAQLRISLADLNKILIIFTANDEK